MKKFLFGIVNIVIIFLVLYLEFGGIYFGFKNSVKDGIISIVLPPYAAYRSFDIFRDPPKNESKWSVEKGAFLLSLDLFHEAEMILQQEAQDSNDNFFTLKKEKKYKIIQLREAGLESSKLVSDSFLNLIHPDLKKYYKDHLIKGTKTLQEQLTMESDNIVTSETLRASFLIHRWYEWASENRKTLDEKFSRL